MANGDGQAAITPAQPSSRLTISVTRLASAACPRPASHHGVIQSPGSTLTQNVDLLKLGKAPIVEERIAELTADVVASEILALTEDAIAAVMASDVSLVCVGAPSALSGGLSSAYVEWVSEQLGTALSSPALPDTRGRLRGPEGGRMCRSKHSFIMGAGRPRGE